MNSPIQEITQLVMIMLVITTRLKYLDAVGEARMLQSAHDDASSRVEALRLGFKISLGRLSRARGDGGTSLMSSHRTNFTGISLTKYSRSPKRIVAEKSRASGKQLQR